MANVVDTVSVCEDCYMLIGTGDASSLDYHYGKDADKRLEEINAGIETLGKRGHLAAGDSENSNEFCVRPCQCCRSSLAGGRHEIVILD